MAWARRGRRRHRVAYAQRVCWPPRWRARRAAAGGTNHRTTSQPQARRVSLSAGRPRVGAGAPAPANQGSDVEAKAGLSGATPEGNVPADPRAVPCCGNHRVDNGRARVAAALRPSCESNVARGLAAVSVGASPSAVDADHMFLGDGVRWRCRHLRRFGLGSRRQLFATCFRARPGMRDRRCVRTIAPRMEAASLRLERCVFLGWARHRAMLRAWALSRAPRRHQRQRPAVRRLQLVREEAAVPREIDGRPCSLGERAPASP